MLKPQDYYLLWLKLKMHFIESYLKSNNPVFNDLIKLMENLEFELKDSADEKK